MIRVSNLRKEQLVQSHECRIICDIKCGFSECEHLWISVPEEFGEWLTDDVYDAFMIAMLYPAMYYNEELVVDGYVSEKLYYNVMHSVQDCEKAYIEALSNIKISVAGFATAKKVDNKVGMGFTAGVDAFATLYDRFVLEENPNYRISTLFFFNVGTHGGGGERARAKFHSRYNYILPLVQELGLPFVPMDSNLFDFYKFEWEYDAGVLCRAFGILSFQRVLKRYVVAYDYSFWEIVHLNNADYASITDMVNYHNLCTEGLDIITDGTQYRRSEKTEKLLNYQPFQKYVNVCVGNGSTEAHNCSKCGKCRRTLFSIDVLGRLDDFKETFDIKEWEKNRYLHLCRMVRDQKKDIYAADNLQLAKRHNVRIPSIVEAYIYILPWSNSRIKKDA